MCNINHFKNNYFGTGKLSKIQDIDNDIKDNDIKSVYSNFEIAAV